MAYKLKKDLAHRSNYGDWRSTDKIDWIVIHYTANDGDTDENNGDYFNGANKKASAHYFVDDDSVTQSVPDNYVAWHCGGGLQGSSGAAYHGKCTNTNSIGIEICDDVKNGTIYPSAKTIENVIAFTKAKMKEYNIPASHVIRHYDVTGKKCPAYWCGSDAKNKKWKTEFHNKLTASAATSKVDTSKKGYTGAFPTLPGRGYYLKGDGYERLTSYKSQIKRVQNLLNWIMGASIAEDGQYGPNTEALCSKYQKKYGLKVDGSFGKESLAKAKTIKK